MKVTLEQCRLFSPSRLRRKNRRRILTVEQHHRRVTEDDSAGIAAPHSSTCRRFGLCSVVIQVQPLQKNNTIAKEEDEATNKLHDENKEKASLVSYSFEHDKNPG